MNNRYSTNSRNPKITKYLTAGRYDISKSEEVRKEYKHEEEKKEKIRLNKTYNPNANKLWEAIFSKQ